MSKHTGMGRGAGNTSSKENAYDIDLTDIRRCLRHMDKLCVVEGQRYKALQIGAYQILNAALGLLQQHPSGKKVYADKSTAIRLRKNKDGSFIKVSGTAKDEWRMPWISNGTHVRYTKDDQYRGKMYGRNGSPGKFIPKAVNQTGTAVIDAMIKYFEDFIKNWKEENPDKKV